MNLGKKLAEGYAVDSEFDTESDARDTVAEPRTRPIAPEPVAVTVEEPAEPARV